MRKAEKCTNVIIRYGTKKRLFCYYFSNYLIFSFDIREREREEGKEEEGY